MYKRQVAPSSGVKTDKDAPPVSWAAFSGAPMLAPVLASHPLHASKLQKICGVSLTSSELLAGGKDATPHPGSSRLLRQNSKQAAQRKGNAAASQPDDAAAAAAASSAAATASAAINPQLQAAVNVLTGTCLLYTSPSPRD